MTSGGSEGGRPLVRVLFIGSSLWLWKFWDRAKGNGRRVAAPPIGVLFCLPTVARKAAWFKPLYDFHPFNVLPRLGKLFANDADSYQYLAESIRMFPDQPTLAGMMERAGFERVKWQNLSGGVVAIHTGWKL